MFFKILHGLAELEMPNYITPAISTTRGNSIKFVQPSAQVDPYPFVSHIPLTKQLHSLLYNLITLV